MATGTCGRTIVAGTIDRDSTVFISCLRDPQILLKARLDGASLRASAHATLHPLMHASWRKSRAFLAACPLLFRRY